MTITANYENGVFRPTQPVSLAEHAVVEVLVPAGEPDRLSVSQSPPKASSARPTLVGFAKGTFTVSEGFDDPLEEFAEYR